jgi:type II secretory pathway predicted ATPase ExeA
MIDKLQAHYGFTRMPFGRDLAPGMLHRHAAHNEAVARITWCITERAIGVITGEVGAGKTASVRTVLAGLDASRHTIIYLPNPMIGVRGLHETIVATFGGTPDRSGSRLTTQATAILAAQHDERGTTPVLVIDEAHLLRYEQLEAIRMLTNHNLDASSPLACLLVGQPTLRRTMKLAVLAAFEQRIALRYTMPPMTSQETSSYITHHLKLALLTELRAGGSRIGGHWPVRLVTFPGHDRTGRFTPGSGRAGGCPDWRAAGDGGPLGALSAG